jgi:predicted RND superfamily exporter protein
MIQLNPAPLDSENSNLLESKLAKNSNRTLKNKKSVEFSTNTVPNTKNNDNDSIKNKITNLGNLMSKIHESNDDDDDYSNNNYSANVIDENISKSLTNSLNSELEKIQKMRQSGNNIPHNVFFNNNELNNEDNTNKGTSKTGLSTNNLYDSNLLGNITKNSDVSNYNDSYNLKYNAPSQNPNITSFDNNKLLSKLEYIIHLLEEQHNEKTNYITEELILYLFLGIFILFVLDSFARASKYVR